MYTTIGAFLGESENNCVITGTRAELFAKYQDAVEKSIKEKEKENKPKDEEEKEDDKKVSKKSKK